MDAYIVYLLNSGGIILSSISLVRLNLLEEFAVPLVA